MAKEQEGSLRKETGKWAIAGGIVAGILGLLGHPEAWGSALLLIGGGWFLKKD